MQRIILHLDMNSYFASVEQQANPFFRNKPVGICAYLPRIKTGINGQPRSLSSNGCIIASSVEAKKVGIKTGCLVKEAQKLYPKVILVENDPNKYRTVTRKLFEIMSSYSGSFEPYSIDEAFLDLTQRCLLNSENNAGLSDFNQAECLANEIRQRIKNEIGAWLRCSIGISFTKFLAKFASDVAGIDSTLVISSKDHLDKVYANYQLTDLWGVNLRMEKRLNDLGIQTILDLKNASVQNLLQVFGKSGYWLYAHVNGIEVDHLRSKDELQSKSIGHSYCPPKQTMDKKYLTSILFKLVFKVGQRLRENNQIAYGLYIHWSYISRPGFSKSFKLKKPVCTTDDIFKHAHQVLHRAKLKDRVKMLAVGVFSLSEPFNQLELFGSSGSFKLTKALDKINCRYNSQMIYRGRMWKTEDLARDRIGFRKVEL